jgi:hypothetical protein
MRLLSKPDGFKDKLELEVSPDGEISFLQAANTMVAIAE